MPHLLILHGPNLGLLGTREPQVYGTTTQHELVDAVSAGAAGLGWSCDFMQSNHEGDLIDAIHAARNRATSIVINPGALTHYSWALHDALAAYEGPIVELHISDPKQREPWRHTSVVEPLAVETVAGKGAAGYPEAVDIAIDASLTHDS